MTKQDRTIDEPDFDAIFDVNTLDDDFLDRDFLDDSLDRIFGSDKFITPQKPIIKFSTLERIEQEILISQMYGETNWGGLSTSNFEMDRSPRGNICLKCRSVKCEHIIQFTSRINVNDLLEIAMKSCSHQSDDEIFDVVCAKCIIESCANVGELNNNPDSLIIGSRNITADGMPSKNTFANKFSNFWYWAETNIKLPDTQSGFRLYPIKHYKNTKFFTRKYEFEIEVLVRSAWSDIVTIPIPINVYYPSEEERITHFRPFVDFARISILNTILVLITFLYIIPLSAISVGIGFGVFMGIAPIWGFQMIVAVLLAHFLKLNKIIVLAFSNISLPPVIPFIIYLSYATGGLVMDNPIEFTTETMYYLKDQIIHGNFYNTLNEFGYSILQYIIGSIILGLLLGGIATTISYIIIKLSTIKNKNHKSLGT